MKIFTYYIIYNNIPLEYFHYEYNGPSLYELKLDLFEIGAVLSYKT